MHNIHHPYMWCHMRGACRCINWIGYTKQHPLLYYSMATKVIRNFLPDLVTAISDCVQPVSDQCLAKGLIPDPVYRGLLESRESSDNKARTLLLAIRTSIKNNSNHLEIFLNILVQQHLACDKLLSDIRKNSC